MREGSALKKIEDAIERYRLDYATDYHTIRNRIVALQHEVSRSVGPIVTNLKLHLTELKSEAEGFIELSNYAVPSDKLLLWSKTAILKKICFLSSLMQEYTLRQGTKTDESLCSDDAQDLPCEIYSSTEKERFCADVRAQFTNVMNSTLPFQGKEQLSQEDVATLRGHCSRYLHIFDTIMDCFGDYFSVIEESILALDLVNPDLFDLEIKKPIIRRATPAELRVIYAPLYQDQRIIEEVINSYTRGSLTKQQILQHLSKNLMIEVISRIERCDSLHKILTNVQQKVAWQFWIQKASPLSEASQLNVCVCRYFARLEFQWFDMYDKLIEQ